MKKIKVLALILAGCLLLAGCGIDKNLKLSTINISPTSFYHNAITGFHFVLDKGETVTDSSLLDTYGAHKDKLMLFEDYYYSIISMVDYCDKIASGAIDTTQIIPPYEYEYATKRLVVFVENVDTTKNNKYTSKLYYSFNNNVSYSQLLQETPILTKTFEFVSQKDEGYTFKELVTDGITGSYLFNKKSGKMDVSFTYVETNSVLSTTYNASTSLYNYAGNTIGGRMYLGVFSGARSETLIGEFLLKDFYKKAKFGLVRDSELYVNMAETEEEFVAKHNDGDQFVFDVVYDITLDSSLQEPASSIAWGKQK